MGFRFDRDARNAPIEKVGKGADDDIATGKETPERFQIRRVDALRGEAWRNALSQLRGRRVGERDAVALFGEHAGNDGADLSCAEDGDVLWATVHGVDLSEDGLSARFAIGLKSCSIGNSVNVPRPTPR